MKTTLNFLLLFSIFINCVSSLTKAQYYFIQSISGNNEFLKIRSNEENKELVRSMFYFGYKNYMKYAHPLDELDPIHCTGRGPDKTNKDNININDVLGDYQLTLVDSLGTLLIMNDIEEFQRAVNILVDTLSFDKDSTVQIFEATIRIIGSLLSTHLMILNTNQIFGNIKPINYSSQLLKLANDLADRLSTAFNDSATGIPHPRVNLQSGVPSNTINESCLAGSTTLLMEFGILSRLLEQPRYEAAARHTLDVIWLHRSVHTGLLGNVINIQSGEWTGKMAGVGAGADSYYEYLLKGYILFDDMGLAAYFIKQMSTNQKYLRDKSHLQSWHSTGHHTCCETDSDEDDVQFQSLHDSATPWLVLPPIYLNVNMHNGKLLNNWIDSLQAALPMILTLNGNVQEAINLHAYYYALWHKYSALPERYNWWSREPSVSFYPLRPEFAESTYHLYRATRSKFYLHVGQEILDSIEKHCRVSCGYATIHDVKQMSLEDRMESFFLSETCKYLYLLFDEDNPINQHEHDILFTTQGHPISIKQIRKLNSPAIDYYNALENMVLQSNTVSFNNSQLNCENPGISIRYRMPLSQINLQQIFSWVY